MLKVSKEIEKKRFKLSFIDSLFYLIREGMVYAYLVYEVLMSNLTIGCLVQNFVMKLPFLKMATLWNMAVMRN